MRATLKHREAGWAVPLLCVAMTLGGSLMAASLQRLSAHRHAHVSQALQAQQSQALAEGLLARVLAQLDDTRAVDASCTPLATAPTSTTRFSDRFLQAGNSMRCRITLSAAVGSHAWSCTCHPGAFPKGPTSTGAMSSGWAELWVETGTPLVRLKSQACVTATDAGAPLGPHTGCATGAESHLMGRASVLLRADGHGRWRVVVGSWTDAG